MRSRNGTFLRAMAIFVSGAAFAAIPALAQDAPAPASAPAARPDAAAKPEAPAKPAAETPPLYDEQADGEQQIARALERAKKDNKHVLIQWGYNKCPWCVRLHELFKADKKIAKALQYDYELVLVDTGPAGKNVKLAESLRADVKNKGFPYLTVLNADGKLLINQDTDSLEVKDEAGKSKGVSAGHDPAKVLKFLTDQKPAYPPAKDILDQGLAAAKAAKKRVFLHFGAPWCIWCRRLETWMAQPQVNELLAKEFLDVKVDVDRTVGGKDLLNEYAGSKATGIPWFALLDADGAVLITSALPSSRENIGFPAKDEEIAHFAAMLKKAAQNLNDGEIDTLIKSLRAENEKIEAAKTGKDGPH